MATKTLAQAKAEAAATKAAQDKAIAAEVAAANAKKAQAQTALAAAKAALKDIATATTQKQLDSLVKQVQAAGLTVPAADLKTAQATIDAPAKAAAEAKAQAAAEAKAAEVKAAADAAAKAKAASDKAAYDASPAGKAAAAEAKAVADRAQADADAKAKAAADKIAADKAAADKIAADKAAAAARVIADREAADRAFAEKQAAEKAAEQKAAADKIAAEKAATAAAKAGEAYNADLLKATSQADIDAIKARATAAGATLNQGYIDQASRIIQQKQTAEQKAAEQKAADAKAETDRQAKIQADTKAAAEAAEAKKVAEAKAETDRQAKIDAANVANLSRDPRYQAAYKKLMDSGKPVTQAGILSQYDADQAEARAAQDKAAADAAAAKKVEQAKAGAQYAKDLPAVDSEKFKNLAANQFDMAGPDGTVYKAIPANRATGEPGGWYKSTDRGSSYSSLSGEGPVIPGKELTQVFKSNADFDNQQAQQQRQDLINEQKAAQGLKAEALVKAGQDYAAKLPQPGTEEFNRFAANRWDMEGPDGTIYRVMPSSKAWNGDPQSGVKTSADGAWYSSRDRGATFAQYGVKDAEPVSARNLENKILNNYKEIVKVSTEQNKAARQYYSDEVSGKHMPGLWEQLKDPGFWKAVLPLMLKSYIGINGMPNLDGISDKITGMLESGEVSDVTEYLSDEFGVDPGVIDEFDGLIESPDDWIPEDVLQPPPVDLPPVDFPEIEPPPGYDYELPSVDEIGFPMEPPPVDEIGYPVEPQPIPQPIETPPVDEIGFPVEPQPIEPPPFEGAPPPEFGGPPQGSIPVTGPNGEELYFDGRDYYDPAGNPVNVGEGPQFGEGRDYAGPGGPAVPPGQQPGQIWDDNQQTWRDPLPGENTTPGQGGYYDDQGRFVVGEPAPGETPDGGGGGGGGPVQPGDLPAPPEGQPPFDTPPGPIEPPPGGGLQLPGPPVDEIPTMDEIVVTASRYGVTPEEIIAAGGVAAFLAKIGGGAGGGGAPGPTPGPGPVQPPGPEPVPIGQPVPEPLPIEPVPTPQPVPEPLPIEPVPTPQPVPEPLPIEPLPPGPEPLPPGPEPIPNPVPEPVPPPAEIPELLPEPPPAEIPELLPEPPPAEIPELLPEPPPAEIPELLPEPTPTPTPTPEPSIWQKLGLTEAQYLAKLAAGYVLINGILTPPAPAKRAPYGPISPPEWGRVGELVNPGLNPGFMVQPPKFYETTSPVQGQYYWGQHAPQTGATFDPLAYNNVPNAPVAPWGLQQMYNPQTQTINSLLSGVQQAATQAPYNLPAAPKV